MVSPETTVFSPLATAYPRLGFLVVVLVVDCGLHCLLPSVEKHSPIPRNDLAVSVRFFDGPPGTSSRHPPPVADD